MKRSDVTTLMVLQACKESNSENGNAPPYDILMNKTKADYKVVISAMERDYDKGLLEAGVSIRCAWLTEKGEQLLKELTK